MTSYKFTEKLGELIEKAEHGSELDVDYIMSHFYNIRIVDSSAANDQTTLHGNHNRIIFVA